MSEPWPVDELRRCGQRVLEQLGRYVEESRAGAEPVVRIAPVRALVEELDLVRWMRAGGMDAEALAAFVQRFLAGSTRLHHPRYLAHQVAVPHFAAALADFVSGVLDNGMSIYEMGPSAAAVEVAVVDWMLGQVGWPPSGRGVQPVPAGATAAGGVLTHGGSLANLTALLAARARAAPDAWRAGTPDDLVLLAPPAAHYATARAASILGLGADALLPLPVDRLGRIAPAALPDALDEVAARGRRVMALVANACATASGLYDPLDAVGRVCAERGIWLHVDGAHGASALLSARERPLLAGLERADSLVWDAHKLLATSALCAAVLVRDARDLRAAFEQQADYIIDPSGGLGVDVIATQVECTKAPLGLKLALVLAFVGEAGLARHVEGLVDLARWFGTRVREHPAFTSPCRPDSNIVLFAPRDTGADVQALRLELLRRGAFHLSQAELDGRRWLRLAIMNPCTTREDLEALLAAVEELLRARPGGGGGGGRG